VRMVAVPGGGALSPRACHVVLARQLQCACLAKSSNLVQENQPLCPKLPNIWHGSSGHLTRDPSQKTLPERLSLSVHLKSR
jgi:hypothetical protein